MHCPATGLLCKPSLFKTGTPGRTRTCYPRLRRPMLYPDELQAQNQLAYQIVLAPGHSQPETILVGVERFELPTSCSQSRRATRLRYTPNSDSKPDLPYNRKAAILRPSDSAVNVIKDTWRKPVQDVTLPVLACWNYDTKYDCQHYRWQGYCR